MPFAFAAALGESCAAEQNPARRIVGRYVAPQLMQTERLLRIAAENAEGVGGESPPPVAAVVNQNADAGAQVAGFEFEEIQQPHSAAVERLDDQSQLPNGIEIEPLFVQKPSKGETRKGRDRSADAPDRRVVLPSVEQVEVFGFESPETCEFSFEKHRREVNKKV